MFEDLDLDTDVFNVPWETPRQPEPPRVPPTEKPPAPPTRKRQPIKRKFPGPAGIISNEPQSQSTTNGVPCSQSQAETFLGPWEQMSNDFRLLNDRGVYLPDKFNIAWIKAQVKNDRLTNGKAPFLAGVIHKLNTKAAVILKDPTGQIHGTIASNLVKDYHKDLAIGSVVTLRQVGVLTRTPNCYLTITSNNLLSIYNGHDVIKLQKYTEADFWRQVERIQTDLPRCERNVLPSPEGIVPNWSAVHDASSLTVEDKEVPSDMFEGLDVDTFFDDF